MASALIFGLSPALSFSRPRLTATVRTTAGVESRRAHHLLLAAQIALTVLLLAGTGAAVRVLIGLYRTSLGYDPHNVIIASINLPENSHTEWADRAAFYERLRNQVADVPQVESVALAIEQRDTTRSRANGRWSKFPDRTRPETGPRFSNGSAPTILRR